jgi:hypothetical protein
MIDTMPGKGSLILSRLRETGRLAATIILLPVRSIAQHRNALGRQFLGRLEQGRRVASDGA